MTSTFESRSSISEETGKVAPHSEGASSLRLEGYLNKKAETGSLWKKRYFVINSGILLWYKNKEDTKIASSFVLEGCNASAVPDRQFNRKFCFVVSSINFSRSYVFQAENYKERDSWIEAVNQAAQAFKSKPGILSTIVDRGELEDQSCKALSKEQVKQILRFTEEDRERARLPSKLSAWRQEPAYKGITSSLESYLSIHTFDAPEGFDQTSTMCFSYSQNAVAFGESSLDSRSHIRLRDLASRAEHYVLQPEGTASMSWRSNILLVGGALGQVYLYKVRDDLKSLKTSDAIFQCSRDNIESATSLPGTWKYSKRINCVEINPHESKYFLTAENNHLCVWNTEAPDSPYVSYDLPSGSTLLCSSWGASAHQIMIGGLSRTLRLLDTRKLRSDNPQKAIAWKIGDAHSDTIQSIAWSPLVSNWVASASLDGTVKLWDLRNSKTPFRILEFHNDGVHCVSWSKSHAEMLVSGGMDGILRLWNVRTSPHYLAYAHSEAESRIIGCSFSNSDAFQYYAGTSKGQLIDSSLSNDFLMNFSQHRFSEDASAKEDEKLSEFLDQETQIEDLLYCRDFGKAYEKIAQVSKKLWKHNDSELARTKLAKLVTLCSSTMFDALAKVSPKSYSKLIRDLAYFVSPNALRKTSVPENINNEILLLRLRLALLKLIEDKKSADILSLTKDIASHVARDPDAIDIETLSKILLVVLPDDFLSGLKFSIEISYVLQSQKRFNDFYPIVKMLLYPTIYHNCTCSSTFAVEASLSKKAMAILDRDLRNPKVVIPQLELLYNVHLALSRSDASSAILDLMEGQTKVLPAFLHRVYLNVLIDSQQYDKFFIMATCIAAPIEGYEFFQVLMETMDHVGFPRFKRFMESCLKSSPSTPWDVQRLVPSCLALINIIENSPILPKSLMDYAPNTLKKLAEELELALSQMVKNPKYVSKQGSGKVEASRIVTELIGNISSIRKTKRTMTSFFEEEINKLIAILHAFQ